MQTLSYTLHGSVYCLQAGLLDVVSVMVGNKTDLKEDRAVATELAEQVTHRVLRLDSINSCPDLCLCFVCSLLGRTARVNMWRQV